MQDHSSKSLRRAETHSNPNLAYAVQLVHAICCLAGSASYLDDIRADLRDCGISRAVRDHHTPVLFDWLVEMLSFQGISDAVAAGYMATTRHRPLGGHCRSAVAKPIMPEAWRVLAVLRLPLPQGVRNVFRARALRCLPLAPPPAAQRPPQPDGVQPVPVHAGRCR